jgi:HlyD family secretion protein
LAAAQASLDLLRAGNRPQDISQAQANLTNAQATLEQSEIVYRQNQQLYKDGAISSRDLDASRTTMEANRARVTQAREAVSLQQAGSRPEEIDRAEAQVVAAAGSLQNVQAQLEDTIIRAPFDGVVVRKYADPGAFVTPTTSGSAVSSATASSILALASNNQVVANVAEANIAQIKVGQTVTLQVDAYPNKKFNGRVVSISPQAIVSQNVTSFEVKAEITSQDKQMLRSGMNASLEFKAGELKNVLVVPTVAIVREKGLTGVYVKTEKSETPVFTPIETGLTVDDKTEIKSGLTGDEKIFISFPEGSRPKTEPRGIPGLSPSPQRSRS